MRLYYGWVIVSYGIVATCIGVGTLTSLSVFLQPVAAELGASRAGVSSVSTLGFLAMGVGGFIWGTLADRFGTRAVVFAGGVLLGVGLLAASQARDLTELQIAYGLVVGLAAGSSFAPLTALTSSWFDRHRSLAVALVSMGLGMGLLGAQVPVQRVETAVTAVDENPNDTLREFKGTLGLNLSQTALENWAGGGESSVAFTALTQLGKTVEKGRRSASWGVDAALGLLRQQGAWRKTDDRVAITAQWSTAMPNRTDQGRLSILLDARSQFLPGYALVDGLPDRDQRISNLLAPGYVVAAAGYAPKPGEHHRLFVAPFTGKLTLVLDDSLSAAGAFGVLPGERERLELGGYIRWNLTWPLMENVNWTHQLDLFSNFMDQPGNIDVNWTGLLDMKVNESLRTTISVQLIYDDDVVLEKDPAQTVVNDQGVEVTLPARLGPGTQFKEVLSVGFAYSL